MCPMILSFGESTRHPQTARQTAANRPQISRTRSYLVECFRSQASSAEKALDGLVWGDQAIRWVLHGCGGEVGSERGSLPPSSWNKMVLSSSLPVPLFLENQRCDGLRHDALRFIRCLDLRPFYTGMSTGVRPCLAEKLHTVPARVLNACEPWLKQSLLAT